MVANNNSQMQRGRILRIAAGITMLALLLAGSAGASTLTVNSSGGANYTRIQDAIDNASNGDTIEVYGGTYFEKVNVDKQLTLRGIGSPVVYYESEDAIRLLSNDITLEGFIAKSGVDYGIIVKSNNNTLIGNYATYQKVGILLDHSNNNTLIGNYASNNIGVGIHLHHSSNNTLIGNYASTNVSVQ